MLHSTAVLRAGGNNIDPRCVNAAVSENIGELGNVLFQRVKHACKEMPQVVRKHLLRIYACRAAQRFHLPPDIDPTDWPSRARDKDPSAFDPLLRRIAEQFLF